LSYLRELVPNHPQYSKRDVGLPEEIQEDETFFEGARRQITINAYERDPRVRQRCIQHYGARCFICGFVFGEHYGEVAEGFIHVHHLRPLSEIGIEYKIDPLEDLRSVCPNCHAVLHLRKPAFSIQEVIDFIYKRTT
jgi:5-methylcytosine-specific restriction protein A